MLPGGQSMDTVDPEQIKTVRIKKTSNSNSKIIQCLSHFLKFLQFKDFLISYNKLSELCFNDCATDFTTRTVKPHEVSLM